MKTTPPSPAMNAPTRRFRWFARAWALAALFHLSLPDVRHWSWLLPNLLLGASAVGLLLRPRVPPSGTGWALWGAALGGLLWPLFFLGDQLTQSVHLSVMALAVLLCARGGEDRAHAHAVRLATVAVYAVAAFHKLNADFLDATVSCATGGVKLLGENWGWTFAPSALDPLWPYLFLTAELGVVVLFRFAPRLAIPVALTMHVPLTIVFAPAFAWVMVAGYPCFFDDDGLDRLAARLRARRGWWLGVGLTFAALDAALYFRDHWIAYPAWQLGEAGVWLLCVGAWLGLGPGSEVPVRGWRSGPGSSRPPRIGRARLLVAAFLLNATTPYLGLQLHHTAAMLSNLRVDEGCWNHLLVPEAVRLRDPYVRVDRAEPTAGSPGRSALVEHLEERLWPPADLRRAIGDACQHGAAPLVLEGSYRGVPFAADDACDALPLPTGHPGLLQTNLERSCPQRCIH